MRIIFALLLIVHGLIVAAQSSGSFSATPASGIPNPSWLSWWPANLGRSFLLSLLGLEKTPVTWLMGLLWLAGGAALVAAGLGLLGLVIPTAWWRDLALTGAGVSLFALLVYLHPFLVIGTGSSLAVLVALLWARLPWLAQAAG